MPYIAEASLALSSLALTISIYSATRKPDAKTTVVYSTQESPKPVANKRKVTVHPDERRFTRTQLMAIAREHNINDSKWRSNAKKAELFTALTKGGLL